MAPSHRHHWFTFSVCCPELHILNSQNALHTTKTTVIIICTDPTGTDSVGQGWELGTGHCRVMQGRVRQRKTGLGSVGKCRTVSDRAEQDRAKPIKFVQGRTWPGRIKQCRAGLDRTAPGKLDQGSASQDKVEPDKIDIVPGRTRRGHEGSLSA